MRLLHFSFIFHSSFYNVYINDEKPHKLSLIGEWNQQSFYPSRVTNKCFHLDDMNPPLSIFS